ncbi:MAG: ACT domain-containing protein [Acidobacteriia bacterium]|nr:ACT domain-containing protein [Terriglobia bacterium]
MPMAKRLTVSRKAKQLSVTCEDRPGTLARLATVLGDSKVDIVAMTCAPFGVQGTVRIVVDDVNRARKVLDREHLPYTEQDVLQVELPNLPGCLGEFAGKLAKQGINITTAYGTAAKGCKKATVILKVSDLDKAARIR